MAAQNTYMTDHARHTQRRKKRKSPVNSTICTEYSQARFNFQPHTTHNNNTRITTHSIIFVPALILLAPPSLTFITHHA